MQVADGRIVPGSEFCTCVMVLIVAIGYGKRKADETKSEEP